MGSSVRVSGRVEACKRYTLLMTTMQNPSIPLAPPREWFTPPHDMPSDTGCIVEQNGRIYGYLCHWGSVLMNGRSDQWKPPRSKTKYAYAHTGDTVCSDGSTVKTANLGGDAGHANVDMDDPDRLENLQSFYEDTSTQLARVAYGEDENGVWFAGACWPTVTDLDIAKLRASARSGHWAAIGDWRDIHSGRAGYELVGACLVNVPGLKYARADKAASGVITMMPMLREPIVQLDGINVEELVRRIGEYVMAVSTLGIRLGTTAYADLPVLDDRQYEWDGDAAESRVREWAEASEEPNAKYAKAFFWFDSDSPEDFGSYKLGYADVVDGELRAIPRGVFAVAAVLQGARGGVEGISDSDLDSIKANVAKYYEKIAEAFDDDTIVPPWSDEMQSVTASGTIQLDTNTTGTGIAVSGTLVVEDQPTEDGRLIEAGATKWRETPLPLYAKLENTDGHNEAQLVGTIDEIYRSVDDEKRVKYKGTIRPEAASEYGQRVLDAIANGELKGVSIDGIGGPEDSYVNQDELWVMTKIVIAGATLTPMPAIHDATVTIGASTDEDSGGGEQMSKETAGAAEASEGQTTTDETPTGDANASDASTDQLVALGDKIDALLEATTQIRELLEATQLNARLNAIRQRERENRPA